MKNRLLTFILSSVEEERQSPANARHFNDLTFYLSAVAFARRRNASTLAIA